MKLSSAITRFLFAAIALVVIVYFYPQPSATHYKFQEGTPWNYAKLIAPFDIPVRPDSASVLRARDSLDRTFVPVFTEVPAAADSVITSLMAQWVRLSDGRSISPDDETMRKRVVAYIKSAYRDDVIDDTHGERITDGTLRQIRVNEDNKVKYRNARGIRSLSQVLDGMVSALGDGAAEWIREYDVADKLQPSLVYDAASSKMLYDHELYRYTAIRGVIQQGQTIIDKGSIITPQDYTNLLTYEQLVDEQMMQKRQTGWMWLTWLGELLYVALLLGALMAYLRFSSPAIWGNPRAVAFTLALITLFFLLSIALTRFSPMAIYLVPFAVAPVLMVVFFDRGPALMVSIVITLLCAGVASFPLEFIALQFCAACAAIYSITELSKRAHLLRTSLFVLGTFLIAYAAIELMLNGTMRDLSARMAVYLAVSALLSALAYVLMPAVEKVFGFTSAATLVELTDVNSPLLRELSDTCPGTFQHAMAVSTLAADAAMRIGADVQLVRAGALYHDIGKLENPNFFTENQHGVNPHDALPPERSAEIITRHVADGLRRADKAGLPQVLRQFIAEHHGRGKAKYFLYTWCQAHPGETPDDKAFSYPGPNPQSRETSVMMMADAVEAASRSLPEVSKESLTELVNKIIDGQIADGLHSESPLSFRDVRIIKEAFVKRLLTMYHSRIVYPDLNRPAAK